MGLIVLADAPAIGVVFGAATEGSAVLFAAAVSAIAAALVIANAHVNVMNTLFFMIDSCLFEKHS
jgi:hypothetical protein